MQILHIFEFCSASWLGQIQKCAKFAYSQHDTIERKPFSGGTLVSFLADLGQTSSVLSMLLCQTARKLVLSGSAKQTTSTLRAYFSNIYCDTGALPQNSELEFERELRYMNRFSNLEPSSTYYSGLVQRWLG